jgi:phage N-6-adenine-methyltransferase
MIAEQAEFVRWWGETVRRKGGEGGYSDISGREISAGRAEEMTHVSPVQVARWRKALEKAEQYRERQIQAAFRKAGLEAERNYRVNTGEFEWYTPAKYLEAAREVMGGIDLDPASHEAAQETVRAERFFTAGDDGLAQDWFGRVWLNPPYSQPLMANFVRKLVDEVAADRVSQAVMLTHNYTDTAWFHLAQASAMLCFTRGRISFVGASGPPTQGQAFFYFGPERERFASAFGAFGFIR